MLAAASLGGGLVSVFRRGTVSASIALGVSLAAAAALGWLLHPGAPLLSASLPLLLPVPAFFLVGPLVRRVPDERAYPGRPFPEATLGAFLLIGVALALYRVVGTFPTGFAPDDPTAVAPATYLTVASGLFVIGLAGLVWRRGGLRLLMSGTLPLAAAQLVYLTFARLHGSSTPEVGAAFVAAWAALHVVCGWVVLTGLFRRQDSMDLDDLRELRW